MKKERDLITAENRDSASFSAFVEQFIETLLWSGGGEYDGKDASHLSPEARQAIEVDCQDFLRRVEDKFLDCDWEMIPRARMGGEEWEQLAHDYCLTRNGHGSGFWDGDWDATGIAKFLTQESRLSGEMHPYYGDNYGLIEVFKG